ncbi:hypothetical protein Emed_007261 [Eimeria media]
MRGHRFCGGQALGSFRPSSILPQSHHQVPLEICHNPACFKYNRGSSPLLQVYHHLRDRGPTRVARILGLARLHNSTSLITEEQAAETGCSTTPEESALTTLIEAQKAAVRPLESNGDTTLSQAWKALVEVEQLMEAQRHLIRNASRLQRSQRFSHAASATQTSAKTDLPSPSPIQSVTDAPPCLSPSEVASFRGVANGIAAQGGHLPTRQLLLFCEKLERMGCCTPSLKAAVLRRLISRSSSLQPYEVALGLQVVALLMRSSEPREVLEMYGLRMQDAAATRDSPDSHIQELCLAAATQLLDILAHNEVLRRRLSVRMLVRTAEACGLLCKQAQSQPNPKGSPATFAAAAAAAASLGALHDGEAASVAAAMTVGGGDSCPGHFVQVSAAHGDRLSLSSCDKAAMGSDSCELVEGAVQPDAEKACAVKEGKAGSQLLKAAWARRIRLSLAPRAAAVLLEEACARQQHGQGASAHADPTWGVESVRAAIATASSGFLTHPTRAKLLKKLLLRLPQLQHRPLNPKDNRQVRAREHSETESCYGEIVGSGSEAATPRVTPIVLASVCHSLATSGIPFSSRQITSIFQLIKVSFPVDDEGLAFGKELSCSLANAVHGMHQASPQRVSGSRSSGLISCMQYTCDVAAFYGEWATVLWAGSRLLKTIASSAPQDPILFEGQQLLVELLLPGLIERLSVAEPRNVGQIADALRVLLLADAKMHALTQDPCMPLLLRQRLQPIDKLLTTLQALGRHLVEYSQAFGAVELLECLRLFVQLDLLYCLDVELGVKACEVPSSAEAQKHIVKLAPSTKINSNAMTTVSAAGILRSALPRLLTLIDSECMQMRGTSSFEGQRQRHQQSSKLQTLSSCDVYARSLLRSLMLKYPNEVLRLPKAIRQGVMRHCQDLKLVDSFKS